MSLAWNRWPQFVHFMLTRAPGPAWVNGWVFVEPQNGHSGRGGGGAVLPLVLRHIRPPLARQATGTTCTGTSLPAPASTGREAEGRRSYDEAVLSSAASSRTTEPRRPNSSASARSATSSRVPAQTSTGQSTSIGTSLRIAAR